MRARFQTVCTVCNVRKSLFSQRSLMFGVSLFFLVVFESPVSVAKEPVSLEPSFLWGAPATDTMGGSVFSGYCLADDLQGAILGARALFFFKYFVGGISGDMTFLDDGTSYSMLLETNARYGPVRSGLIFGMKWLPGSAGSPSPAIGVQVALSVPLGIEGIWLDLAYRPTMIFFKRSQMVNQSFCLGLVFEAGL